MYQEFLRWLRRDKIKEQLNTIIIQNTRIESALFALRKRLISPEEKLIIDKMADDLKTGTQAVSESLAKEHGK